MKGMELINYIAKQIRRLVFPDNLLYYIGSCESLPAPLNKQEEAEFIALWTEGDSAARDELIRHNLRLVVYIARKFESNQNNLEDIVSIGTIGLIKAVNTFRSDKNIKLATYASKCIENEILMHFRKNGKLKTEVSLSEPLTTDKEGNELVLADIISAEDVISENIDFESDMQVLSRSLEKLTPQEKEIIFMRYGLEGEKKRTQKQVATLMNISQSYISRLEKRIVGSLRKEADKLMK